MKKYFKLLTIFAVVLTAGSVFADDTFVSAKYMDDNNDGTIDRIRILFDEDTGSIGYEAEDWTINNAGDINISITGAFGEGNTALILEVNADAFKTGGSVNPIISYNNDDGDNSIELASGPLSNKANMEVTDDAKPFVREITPVTTPTADKTPDIVLDFSEEIDSLFNDTAGCMIAQSNLPAGNNTLTITKDGLGTDMDLGTYNCKITNITDKSPAANVLAGPFSFSQFVIDVLPELYNPHMANIDEDVAIGTTIYNMDDVSGGDTDGDGNVVTYAITGGDANHDFVIDVNTGAITTAKLLDYETKHDYNLEITGTSANGSGIGHVFQNLNDINETPVPVSGFGDISVPENQIAVTTLIATDPEGLAITYSIIDLPGEPLDGNLYFDIDPATGVLTFKNAPDFENPLDTAGIGEPAADNKYLITVRVSDGVKSIDSFVTVTVTDIDESSHRSGGSRRVSKEKLKEIFAKAEETKEEVKKETEEVVKETTCSYTYSKMIKRGSRGDYVKQLQVTLNGLGFNTGVADGIVGPNTLEGIKAFQRAMGIMADGVFGPQSNGKLSLKCSA